MREAQARSERQSPSTSEEEHLGNLSQRLARLYRRWLTGSLLLLVLGTLLDLFDDGRLSSTPVPLHALPSALWRGDPGAVESLALLFLVFGPVAGLLTMLVVSVRHGDRRTALLALAVILVVATLPIVRAVGGR